METCPNTGITRPECSCSSCCQDLLARYAPELLAPPAAPAAPAALARRAAVKAA